MKHILAAIALTLGLTVATTTPADAHQIRCAQYVGNEPCFRHARQHQRLHQPVTIWYCYVVGNHAPISSASCTTRRYTLAEQRRYNFHLAYVKVTTRR